MGDNDIDIGRLEGKLGGVEDELKTLNRLLVGNGQRGVLDRMARVEENIENLSTGVNDVVVEQSDQIGELSGSVNTLAQVVEAHCGNESYHTPKGLLLRKEVIAALVVLVVIIVVLATGPDSLAWGLVMSYLGL